MVLVVDEKRCDPTLFAEYSKAMRIRAQEDYADRRMREAEDGYRGNYDY